MKIAHIIKSFSLGGGPRAVFYMCKALPKYKFLIYAIPGMMESDFKTLDNVEIKHVNRWNMLSVNKVYSECINLGVDIIHIHNMMPGVYFLPCNKIKRVITFHGLHIRKYDYINAPIKQGLRKYIKNLFIKNFDKIVVLTDSDRKYLENLLYDNKNISKITVIPNAVELNIEKIKSKGDVFDKNYFNLLVVARYDYQKGLDILVDMVKKLRNREQFYKVYFIGDQKVRELVQDANDDGMENLIFLEETNNPYGYMKAADALLLPSRWEGLPMVVLEALMLGTKVIASDTANINDLVDGENVMLYELENSTSFYDVIKKVRYGLSRKIENYSVSEFSVCSVGKKLMEIYTI